MFSALILILQTTLVLFVFLWTCHWVSSFAQDVPLV